MNFTDKLNALKKEKDVAILAHYYVDEEIQALADYVGDSFYLAQKGRELTNKRIIMAGVYFMGETIKTLNPDKKVYNLNWLADCPMAHMANEKDIVDMRNKYDDLAVVTYVNSTIETKALSDVCVTSSNAAKICKKLKEKNIFFIPDKNLGAYVSEELPDKNFIFNRGACPRHNQINKEDILSLKKLHPRARVLAHPECKKEVLDLSDYIGSTKGIINEASKSSADEFIVVTVKAIRYELERLNPDKTFYFLDKLTCLNMNMHKKEDLLTCMDNPYNEVKIDEDLRQKALKPLERMLELGK